MNKKWSIGGVSILAVVLIMLGSQTNVVGYQAVHCLVEESINRKDLAFQTIIDLTNNKEIQKTILQSQESKFLFPFPLTTPPIFPTVTKKQLNFMYYLGIALLRTIGKNRMISLAKEQPLICRQTMEKINAIIRNDAKLSGEMTQLSLLDCPCSQSIGYFSPFPVLCFVFFILSCIFELWMILTNGTCYLLYTLSYAVGRLLHCVWSYYPQLEAKPLVS